MVQPMVSREEGMGSPEHAHPAQAQLHPLKPQTRQWGQRQGDVIDTFTEPRQPLAHAASAAYSSKRLQI